MTLLADVEKFFDVAVLDRKVGCTVTTTHRALADDIDEPIKELHKVHRP